MPAEPEPPTEPDTLSLAADFPPADAAQWRAAVSAVLTRSGVADGVDPVAELSFTTYDGITIRPLYTADDAPATGEGSGGRWGAQPSAGWDVRARHADPDPVRTRQAILDDLERGATSLWLVLGDAGIAVDDLPAVLDGVYLDLAAIVLDAGAQSERAGHALLSLAEQGGTDPAELSGSLGADPIGLRARTGAAADPGVLLTLAEQSKRAPNLRVATIDATVYHEAGASDGQELGIAASVGVAYLRALVDGGVPVDAALNLLEFRYAVTDEQFPSIAKLRAARRVWDRIAELSGAADDRAAQRQHAVTSAAMLTRRDPWVNLLRGTIGCFAAAIGGADAITVLPFDAALGLPDDFSRRIARNTHAVLHDESSLARVLDAAGGSWFVESLTDELAHKAWDVFTDLERHGGALAALDDGTIRTVLAATQDARADDIAHRRAPITGVTEFAFVGETPVHRPPAPSCDTSGALLPSLRYAQDFEELRDRTDDHAAATGERPTVFLAGLGSPAASSGRSGFAANLFQAAGIECVVAAGDVDDLVTAFRDSGTNVACLCSTDKIYADVAAPAARALRDAGAGRLWLAGKHETDGVDGYVHVGCDALAVLRSTLETLGVK